MRYVVDEYGEEIKTRFSNASDVVDFLNERLDVSAVDVLVVRDNSAEVLFRKTALEFIEIHS